MQKCTRNNIPSLQHNPMKTFFIKTFGCQMNVYDSAIIAEGLTHIGITSTNDMEHADVIVFNTCTVRGLAEHKALSELGATRKLKEQNPHLIVGIVGCAAQRLGKRIAKQYNFVSFVCGTKEMYKVPQLVMESMTHRRAKPVVLDDLSLTMNGYKTTQASSVSAYVTVIRGCSNYCSYCIVPFVRGKEESRTIEEISAEVQGLCTNGVKEIILLGQNVNAFGIDTGTSLESLIEKLHAIESLKRIRYITSHPKSVTQSFVRCAASLPKVCEHIHLPFQSGSNAVLCAMNRHYTREEYLDIIALLREHIPNIAISTDCIVGYPGETEKDFEDTLNLVHTASFDAVFGFKYSPRQGTSAATQQDNVPRTEKEQRLKTLMILATDLSLKKNRMRVGTTQEVLWESDKMYQGVHLLEGKTRTNIRVFVPYVDGEIGICDPVYIDEAYAYALRASLSDTR